MTYKKFEDPRTFGKLFGIYRFKKSYSDYINGLMQKLYQNERKWGNPLGLAGNYGIINTDISLAKAPMSNEIRDFYATVYDNTDPKWSLLNYVNTHWTCFMHIINVVNYWISKGQVKNQDYFTFDTDIFNELERLKTILNKTAQHILMPDSNLSTFWKIMGALATSTYIGNLGENKTLESLAHLGYVTDVIKSQPGLRIDTHGGVDISFKLDGVKKTLQCKSFTNVDYRDGQYIFSNISNSSWYNVDFFSFVNKRNIYVFDTKADGLKYSFHAGSQSYVFDKRLLKYKLEI